MSLEEKSGGKNAIPSFGRKRIFAGIWMQPHFKNIARLGFCDVFEKRLRDMSLIRNYYSLEKISLFNFVSKKIITNDLCRSNKKRIRG